VRRLLVVSALASLVGGACSLQVDYSGSHFACEDGTCPRGFQCNSADECVAVSPPDAAVPADAGPKADSADFCSALDQVIDPTTGHCFQLERTLRSWESARVACDGLADTSHLAAITSTVQDALVSQLADGFITYVWLGATDSPAENQWHWLDNRTFPPASSPSLSFAAWDTAEPNDTGASCAAIDLKTHPGKWVDRGCAEQRPSVCELEP
jgi:hypothetical protein